MKTRPFFLVIHRWIGLGIAPWLFILGFTGSVLVFHNEIDRALNPDLWRADRSGATLHLPVESLIDSVAKNYPSSYVTAISLPQDADDTAIVYVAARKGSNAVIPTGLQLFFNPYSGELQGERIFGGFVLDRHHIVPFIYELHMSLHLGEWMEWLLGFVALLWIVQHLSSLGIAFPSLKKWRQSFRIKRNTKGYRRIFDLHRAGSLWVLLVTLTLAITGMSLHWKKSVKAAVGTITTMSLPYDQTVTRLPSPMYNPSVSIDQAIATTQKATLGAPVDRILFLVDKGLYRIHSFDPRDIDFLGRRYTYVDMTSGKIMSDRHVTEESTGNVILAWPFPLHSGKAFGWAGRIAIFLTGMAVCIFSVTGIMIWLRKRKYTVSKRE